MYIPTHIYICMYRTHPQFKARTLRVDMHIYTVRTRKTKKPVVSDITAARVYTLRHALCQLFCYDTQSALLYMLFSNSSHKSETRNRSQGYRNSRVAHKHTNTHTRTHTSLRLYTPSKQNRRRVMRTPYCVAASHQYTHPRLPVASRQKVPPHWTSPGKSPQPAPLPP